MDPLKTLCIQRWNFPTIDIEEGVVRLCCRVPRTETTSEDLKNFGTDAILNTPYLRERRAEMFAGKQHSDCHVCWAAENRGAPSPRTGAYQLKQYYEFNRDETLPATGAQLPITDPILRADHPAFVELQLGIICDLKCIYCWRGNSSSWLTEDYRFGDLSKEEYERLRERVRPDFAPVFWEWFEKIAETVQMVSFVGGEPTLSPKFIPSMVRVLQILKEKNSRSAVRIVTNLNCTEVRMTEFLKSLDSDGGNRIYVDVSMESFGAKAEFIRSGLRLSLIHI